MRCARAYGNSCSQTVILVYIHPFRHNLLFCSGKMPKSLKPLIFRVQGHSRSSILTFLRSSTPVLVMISSMSVLESCTGTNFVPIPDHPHCYRPHPHSIHTAYKILSPSPSPSPLILSSSPPQPRSPYLLPYTAPIFHSSHKSIEMPNFHHNHKRLLCIDLKVHGHKN